MYYKSFLVKYAEIGLKGKNRAYFEDCLVNQIRLNLSALGDYKISKEQGRISVDCPDGYAWERAEVRKEIEQGKYLLDTDVNIKMLVDLKSIYSVGEGHLRHTKDGFELKGCEKKLLK